VTRLFDVDEVLRTWLAEGSEQAPSIPLEAALEQIADTRQRRPTILSQLGGIWEEGRFPLLKPLTFAAVGVLVTAMGLGLGIGSGLIRLPAPSPVPAPSGIPAPDESDDDGLPAPSTRADPSLRLFSSHDDGYELLIPATWDVRVPQFDGEPAVGVHRFGSAVDHAYGALTISIGDPDGTIRVCEATCREAQGQFSLEDLELTLEASAGAAGWSQVHEDTQVDGEPARIERPATGGVIWAGYEAFRHVYTFHDGRPVVLSFDHWSIKLNRLGPASVDQIIESFRFLDLDGEASESPTP